MSPSTPYKSRLLDSKDFRVVRVAAGRWHDPIRCTLINRKLGEESKGRPYKALSYVWGSSSVTDIIFLQDQPIRITLNLFCALLYLRNAEEDIFLWVDALVGFDLITFIYNEERSLQVSIMQLIYKNAEQVIVFMGDGRGHRVNRSLLKEPPPSPTITLHGDKEDKAFLTDFMSICRSSGPKELSSSLTAAACAIGLIRLFSDQDTVQQAYFELSRLDESVMRHLFECLRAFVVCPWWRRIWVVQEITVGTAPIIQYGTITAHWKVFVLAAKFWSLAGTGYLRGMAAIGTENVKVFTRFANQLSSLERTRSKWLADGGADLVRILQEFSDREASDDRDKVYGLLSLAKQGPRSIRPDYKLDVYETYRATALSLIRDGQSLACWAGDQKRKFHRGLPSWIPDWSAALDPGDKRRMDFIDNYNANSGWTLQFVEDELSYWITVEEQMKQLMESSTSRSVRLPQSLGHFVIQYMAFLKQRDRSLPFKVDADDLRESGVDRLEWNEQHGIVSRSNLNHLKWCQLRGISPRSGMSLLSRWIDDLENWFEAKPQDDSVKYKEIHVEIRRHLRDLGVAVEDTNLEMARRKSDAELALLEIESIILTTPLDCVDAVGSRLLGWADTKSAMSTLASWLHLPDPNVVFRSDDDEEEIWLDPGRVRPFAKTIIGGISCLGVRSRNANEVDFAPLENWVRQSLAVEDFAVPPSPFFEAVQDATDGRVFFLTRDGSMGLGPASMQNGDTIHILPSGRTHFVLRKKIADIDFPNLDDPRWIKDLKYAQYELIGDCYLHTDDRLENQFSSEEEPVVEGSLPFELLGTSYLKSMSLERKTIMLV
ncbi:hypothetical protein J7T55_014783 [Diaporthe amygdali]|uniref:uncharacterized protein n=1 Tax=Phomopsis amygdali TaxID=1214568 RepID=UPI0022FEC83E|nr:uncharacterized protein J7T55_014783 [Diaporthe amygdali]KAJ0109981.1 hypothetical protein J7T55_014783 [Diaporthe amygdali]